MENIVPLKQSLRRAAREKLRALSVNEQASLSERACQVFLQQEVFQKSAALLLYMPLQGELDVRWIVEKAISTGKRVALPRFVPETGAYSAFFVDDKPLIPGPFGILEPGPTLPAPLNRLDLILVPGLAFDLRGRRLGRGKGFYDRMLAEASGVKCGICFEEQLFDAIPVEPHDVGVRYLATPSRWQDCQSSSPA